MAGLKSRGFELLSELYRNGFQKEGNSFQWREGRGIERQPRRKLFRSAIGITMYPIDHVFTP